LLLGSEKALFILLIMSLKLCQGDYFSWRYEDFNVCTCVKNMQNRNGLTQSGAELLWSGRKMATKVGNNLGLSSCAVFQSAVVCVVADFRRTELLPGVQERSGI